MNGKGASGFTIVELLVTLLASAILIGSVSVALNAQVSLAQRGRDLVIANAYAEGEFEALRSKGFLGLADGTNNITSDLPTELKAPRSGSLVISAETASVKRVVLTLTYNDRGDSRTYSYTTYIGELGVGQY